MSTQGSGASLFSRKKRTSSEPPPDDPVKAPYGWMKDRDTGEWRPRKSWGGAGRGAHKVGGQPGGRALPKKRGAPKRGPGRPKGSRNRPKATPVEQLHIVEPASEEEWAEEAAFLGADPAPFWQRDEPEPAPPEAEPETLDMRAEIESWIALGWSIPAETLATMDPYCFGPLVDDTTGPLVVKAFADIAMQSPKVAEFITSKSGLRPYIQLAYAFKPVIQNAWRHHISRKVEVDVDRASMTYSVRERARDYSEYPAA